jgi:hypothetical protein
LQKLATPTLNSRISMSSSELRFSDFLAGSQQAAHDTSDVQTEVVDTSSQEQPEVALETPEVTGTDADSGLTQGQGEPTQHAVRFEDFLRQKGISVGDETDPAELYESVISRALAGSQAMSEVARLRSELDQLRVSQPIAPAAAPQVTIESTQQTVPETAATLARRFRELQKYDSLLENYVERDDSGYAKPITSFGAVSIDAARTINEYERASREQADLLLRNPLAVVEDSQELIARIAEEQARKIVESRLSEIQSKTEQEYQQLAQAEQARQESQRLTDWHESHKSSLFNLDESGAPKQVKDWEGNTDMSLTPVGKAFKSKLMQLRDQLPGAPELTLRQLAFEFASAVAQAPQAAVQQPAPVQTQAQQKRLLADSRQPVPNQNTPPAEVGQIARTLPTLRLANMVRSNPELAERVSGWRN